MDYALTSSLLVTGAFIGTSLVVFLLGRMLIGGGRNRADEIGSRRPLILGGLTEPMAAILPVTRSKAEKLKKELVRAGYYHRKALEEYLAFRNAALVSWLLFVATALVTAVEPGSKEANQLLVLGGGVALLIYSVPRLILSSQATARTRRIHHALPDALDMITMTVSGGVPLQRAIKRVGQELNNTHRDLACELTIIHHQADAGSLEQALNSFASRVDVPEVTALATLVRHAERLGGNVAAAFREFADSVRRTRRQRAEEQGNKASVKLLFPVVLCLAPPIYILLLGPATLELRNFMNRESMPGGILGTNNSIDEQLNQPITP